jgi:hypothetical protein
MKIPMRTVALALLAAGASWLSLVAAGPQTTHTPQVPQTPQASSSSPSAADIVARSLAAHGGDRLTSWKTLTIKGTVVMQDGIAYNGAYTLLAKAPDRVRVEHDATADRGRAFYEYFLNGGVAWTRRNLIPASFDAARIQRWLDQCYGIAIYAKPGVALELKGAAEMAWPPATTGNAASGASTASTASTASATGGASGAGTSGAPTASAAGAAGTGAASRRVWIVVATVGVDTRELAIDQETSRFLREVAGDTTRIYWDFASFDDALMPTRILEIAKTRQGETRTPINWKTVVHDAPIEDWRFTEDMPAKPVR